MQRQGRGNSPIQGQASDAEPQAAKRGRRSRSRQPPVFPGTEARPDPGACRPSVAACAPMCLPADQATYSVPSIHPGLGLMPAPFQQAQCVPQPMASFGPYAQFAPRAGAHGPIMMCSYGPQPYWGAPAQVPTQVCWNERARPPWPPQMVQAAWGGEAG
eukprot:2346657-Pleurochrysis_carterae.AAC.2